MHLPGMAMGTGDLIAGGGITRHLRTAAQRVFVKIEHIEPAPHPVGMDRRALVGGTGQRKLLGPQPRAARLPAFQQRQRLDHLDRRAREDQLLRIAPAFDDFTIGTADHRMAAMDTFQKRPAPQFNKIHRAHARFSQQNSANGAFGAPHFCVILGLAS